MKAAKSRKAPAQQKAALAEAIKAFRDGVGMPSLAWAQQSVLSAVQANGEAVLCRLLDHPGVPAAFAKIPLPGWGNVLTAAITGEQMARAAEMKTHGTAAADRNAASAARSALRKIKTFLGDDALPFFVGDDAEEVAKALNRLSEAIEDRAGMNDIRRAQRPRKHQAASARSLGIGRIKEAVARACGRPNFGAVATIAEAALGTSDAVSLDAIRKALTPSDLALRVPIGHLPSSNRTRK